jgi:hypothetical protein
MKQKEIHRGISLKFQRLIMHSHQSKYPKNGVLMHSKVM